MNHESYIEGEADRTSLGGPTKHLKFHHFYIVNFHSAISQPSSETAQGRPGQTKTDQGKVV